jgi:flagellin
MSLVINTNIASLTAQQNLNTSQGALQTSLQRLSSGLRINSAADDPAGLAIADGFTSQINGLNQATQNANDGISLAQTADGALQQVTNNLQTIRQLAVEAANSTNSSQDRQALDQEVQQDIAEINRIATQTSFNNQNVLDGTFGSATFQVGANVGQTIGINLGTSIKTTSIGQFVNQAGTQTAGVGAAGATATGTNSADYVATAATNTYAGVTSTAFDGTNTYTITPNGGSAQTIAASANFTGQASLGQTADSAYAKAAAINGSGISSVTASASTSVDLGQAGAGNWLTFNGGGAAGATEDYQLTINGVTAFDSTSTATGATANDFTVGSVITSINAVSSQTGVIASANATTGDLVLTAADGRNITVGESLSGTAGTGTGNLVVKSGLSTSTATGGAATALSLSGTSTYRGQVTLQGNTDLALSSAAQTALGFTSAGVNTSGSLAGQNVLTVNGANATILSVDSALTQVDQLAATFGAIQNRFDSAIASLGTTTTNLTAARSAVQDADFASETSNLTRAQILQQAGVSILAQANALPQGVLKLLQ